MSALQVVLLVGWGALVGADLASVPQGLLSRPVVAATLAGILLGDAASGLLVGVTLELYALDVMPVGASRYPDFGTAAVPATAAAALAPPAVALGAAGLVGLPLAVLGGWALHQVRRRNAVAIEARRARLAAGDARAIWELQRDGMLRDVARGACLTLLGLLGVAAVVRLPWAALGEGGGWLGAAVLAGGVAAALAGGVRRAGPGTRRRWLAVGLATGLAVVLTR